MIHADSERKIIAFLSLSILPTRVMFFNWFKQFPVVDDVRYVWQSRFYWWLCRSLPGFSDHGRHLCGSLAGRIRAWTHSHSRCSSQLVWILLCWYRDCQHKTQHASRSLLRSYAPPQWGAWPSVLPVSPSPIFWVVHHEMLEHCEWFLMPGRWQRLLR